MKPNVTIAGDEIWAGVDLEDAEETGPIENAIVIQFESKKQLNEAIEAGSTEFDFMRLD